MKPSHLSNIPLLPGIYIFKDSQGTIIYVGKAKSLRKRVSSYFRKQETDWKVQSLIQEHASIDHIVTHSETEALLLEAQLIRDNQPKFNVLLKNGQPFLYIKVSSDEELPRMELVRNKKGRAIHFGPFLHKRQARAGFEYLMKTFRLELCNQKIKDGCLKFHIGICAGSCRELFDKEGYLFRLQLAMNALKGHYKESLAELKERIAFASRQMEFEKAQRLNFYLQNLDVIFQTLKTKFSEKKYEAEIEQATFPVRLKKEPNLALAEHIKDFLALEKPVHSIDCFDISHFQSNALVGSCIRFVDGVPEKNKFRRFAIKTLTQQNDYAALQEIVSRRYRDPQEMPDLILIDGGKGQLNAIKEIFPEAPLVSLAKREERLFSKNHPDGFVLDKQTEIGRIFMELRDYAHHFAITYHRKKLRKDIL